MELKDQVQGVVIGLFGAYAGGYFADLTSQAETGNPVALVEGLVNLQTPLLGVNLSDDAAWVDTILGHLGVSSTSAAYTAAAAWANGELDAGASRAEVVLAAVTYLLGDSVEAQYASVATAFKADVAAGVEYSEGAGAEVLAIGDLREAAGNPATGTSFNLTAALAEWTAADKAVSDFLKDVVAKNAAVAKDLGANTKPSNTEIRESLEDVLAAAGEDLGEYVNLTDSAELNQLRINATKLELELDVTTTTKAVNGISGLKTLVDALPSRIAAVEAAALKEAKSEVAFKEALIVLASRDGSAISGKVLGEQEGDLAVVGFGLDLQIVSLINTGSEEEPVIEPGGAVFTYDAQKGTFELVLMGATTAQKTQAAETIAALNTLRADQIALDKAETALGNAIVAVIEKETGNDFEGDFDLPEVDINLAKNTADLDLNIAELAPKAQAYLNALNELAAFNKAVAAYQPLLDLAVQLEALDKAVEEAFDILDAEYALVEILAAGQATEADVGSDLFIATKLKGGQSASIDDFGFNGSDVLFFGSSYKLVEIGATQTLANNLGDINALEIFWQTQANGDLKLFVETATFGGNANGNGDIVTITLIGFSAEDISAFNGSFLVG